MEVNCSFQKLFGGRCALDNRDPKQTNIIPLLSCKRDISGHKKSVGISDVESEVELILARASIFSLPSDVFELTVCPSHRYSLGIGWRRGSQRCRVPESLCKHAKEGRPRKADRGLSKALSGTILRRTGVFVAPGSGMYFMLCLLKSKCNISILCNGLASSIFIVIISKMSDYLTTPTYSFAYY